MVSWHVEPRRALARDRGARQARKPAFEERFHVVRPEYRLGFARRQILIDRCISQLGHQAEASALGSQPRDLRCGVVEVTEEPSMGGTYENARRLSLLGWQQLVVDAIDAKRALLHRTRRGDELARTVRTRPGAKVASHALVLI